jgi:hypothetical protein
MATIGRPLESAAQPATRQASWRLAALGLVTLYALEIFFALFWMSPLNSADSWDLRWYVRAAGAGAVLSLPVLLATAGVLASGRVGVRLLVSASFAVLSIYAMIVGSGWNDASGYRAMQSHEIISFAISFLASSMPAFAVKWSRRWTIVPEAPKGQLPQRQYSVAGIMLATACVATVIGLGRWVLPLGRWQGSADPWANLLLSVIVGGVIAWSCLPILPLTALVLGVGRRLYLLVATPAIVGIVYFGLYVVMHQVNALRGIQYFSALISGAYVSAFAYLLVIRACGFRLVRRAKRRNVEASARSST